MKINYSDTNILIELSKKVHGNKYDYSLLIPTCNREKIKIICPIHGIFEQRIYMHIFRKQGCSKCEGLNMTNQEFLKQSKIIHNDNYSYENTKFISKKNNVIIKCKIHGYFEQNPYLHLKGHGCPKCAGCKISNKEEFVEKSNKIHNNKYDYSLVNYKNAITHVKISCKKHGVFEQTPNKHLSGKGCPICCESKGERKIRLFLKKQNIEFISEKKFDGCEYKKQLRFDFYLPNKNCCIEFDGEQHYQLYKFEKTTEKLEIRKKRDQIKNIYCQENNIKLHRIKYNDNLIEKLTEILNDH